MPYGLPVVAKRIRYALDGEAGFGLDLFACPESLLKMFVASIRCATATYVADIATMLQ